MSIIRRASGAQVTIDADDFETYRDSGWQPIPLHPWNSRSRNKRGKLRSNGKRPRDFDWTRRTYDPAKVIAECIAHGRNMGIRLTARQLVVDVDPRRDGEAGFAALCRDLELDPRQWPRVETGSGGSHFYLTLPEGVRVLDTLPDYPGVEFKSGGRQVVAAGSIHPDTGRRYWRDTFDHPELADAPQAPARLVEAIRRRRPERTGEAAKGGRYAPEQVARMLASLDPTDFRDHDKWLRLMMAVHHASGADARSEFVEWSTSDPQYADDADVIGRRWDSLHVERNDGVTAATLRKFVQDEGDSNAIPAADASSDFEPVPDDELSENEWLERGGTSTEVTLIQSRGLKLNRYHQAPDTYDNAVAAVMQSGLAPAWDELKQSVVFTAEELPWQEGYGRVLTDHVGRLVRLYLANKYQGVAYVPSKEHLFEALMTVAYGAKFNPVLNYLGSITWDGKERVTRLFSDYFNCDDDAYTRGVSQAFMVGAVRRMRQPGCKFDTMPVLRSPQGWNKSSAVRELFGEAWYSDTDLGDLRDKDSVLKLRGIWIQEFAEIDSLTRAASGTLKAFCSRATDRVRDPYGRTVEDSPRRCVFIATVNEGGYLKDSTGGRRFWPLDVGRPVDLARIASERDQLWAEAAALEANGASDVLARELWPIAAERQSEQTSGDPWADTLQVFLDQRAADYRPASDGTEEDGDGLPLLPPGRVHSSELFEALGIAPADQTKDKAQRLRTVMELALGWHHSRGVRVIRRAAAGYTRERLTTKMRS